MAADEQAQIIEQAQREARINECDEMLRRLGLIGSNEALLTAIDHAVAAVIKNRQWELIREREAE